jgi:hypothetical protein
MKYKKELTEEEREYLCENFGWVKADEIAKHLQVSYSTVRRYAKSLGLIRDIPHRKKQPGQIINKKPKHNAPIHEEGYEYCLYCSLYRVGGTCERDGKPTGALHQKSCFIANEEGTNN